MSRPSLLRLAGTILIAASAFVFLLGFVSGFYGHFAVTAFLVVIFVLMLCLGSFIMDKGDEKDGIRTDRHKEDFASAVELIRLYADKYHDKDAEYAKEHIEALNDIYCNRDYHIQQVRDLNRQQIQIENTIIDIAGKIRKAYGADKTCH